MRRLLPVLVTLVATVAADGCSLPRRAGSNPLEPTAPVAPLTAISTAAKAHLEALLEIMQKFSINTHTIDWMRFRTDVFDAAGLAQTIPDTYRAIEVALRLLNDTQSYYLGADRSLIGPSPVGCGGAAPAALELPANVGYLRVEPCDCGDRAAATYAESMQRAIMAADRPGLAGWIVDFRGNLGGNMWPMIAGLGPILGEGIVGYIVYNDRDYEREYTDGAALSLGEIFAKAETPYTLMKQRPRVAVLIDGSVASAGEAVVVYFKARPATRSFGMPTCGHHHLQFSYGLGNGAALYLAISEHADRTKKRYAGALVPDEMVADSAETARRAIAWLQTGS